MEIETKMQMKDKQHLHLAIKQYDIQIINTGLLLNVTGEDI